MTKASDNEFPSVLFDEQASDPATPGAGLWRLFFKAGGLYAVDDAGTVIGPFAVSAGGGGGSFDFLGEVALASPATNMQLASIPGSYRALMILARARTDQAAAVDGISLRVGNGSADSGANYDYMFRYEGQTASTQISNSATFIKGPLCPAATAAASYWGIGRWLIYDYADTTYYKVIDFSGGHTESASERHLSGNAQWRSASAIDVVRLLPELGTNFVTGSKMTVYGLAAS